MRWLALCLFSGAVAQAFLAWAILLLAYGLPHTTTLTAAEVAHDLDVPQIVNPDRSTLGPPSASMNQRSGSGWHVSFERGRVRDAAGKIFWGEIAVIRCGWPYPCFDLHWGRIASDPSWPDSRKAFSGPDGSFDGPLERSPAGQTLDFFPTHPLWKGQVLNTVIFAAAFFALSLVLRACVANFRQTSRDHRRSEGGCENCGYPLLDLLLCPECGTPRHTPSAEQPPPESGAMTDSGQS